jgi:F0F1-type ATP synthase membrane subunit b/b'
MTPHKIWAWIKKYPVQILGAIVALLIGILAIKYEWDKISSYKAKVIVEKTKAELAKYQAQKEALKGKDAELVSAENGIDALIANKKEELNRIENRVRSMSDEELSEEFNRLYHNR